MTYIFRIYVNSYFNSQIIDEITKPDRITIHLAADLDKLSTRTNPSQIWKNFLPKDSATNDFK